MTMAAAGPVVAQNASATPAVPKAASPAAANDTLAANNPVPSAERRINIITLRDLEAEAAINRWVIEPDFLSGYQTADTMATLFGSKISMPIITAPVASHVLFNTAAEAATVKGTGQAGSIYACSSESSLDLEAVAAARNGPKWFQIYLPSDRGYARELLQRAKAAGYKLIVITVDATVTSNRERVMRILGQPVPNFNSGNKPRTAGIDPLAAAIHKRDLNWDDVAFCGTETGLPVVVKSIISAGNVTQAIERGCAGVWISNHGGRQLDNTAAPMTALPRIADAVNGRVPIIVVGGFRRGQDVFRALALGASAVVLGRPVIYGISLGCASGVQSVLQYLKTELQMVMQLLGVPSIKDIIRQFVAPV
jgi:isopentenyl diphosphate isomerase/L-lactate dehydrogenase-like FMN-dependent dehydrogenase